MPTWSGSAGFNSVTWRPSELNKRGVVPGTIGSPRRRSLLIDDPVSRQNIARHGSPLARSTAPEFCPPDPWGSEIRIWVVAFGLFVGVVDGVVGTMAGC